MSVLRDRKDRFAEFHDDGCVSVRVGALPQGGQKHDRLHTAITAVWPTSDAFSVQWTADENVRRYRIAVIGGSAGDYVKFVEDAVNAAQAAAWLATVTTGFTAKDVEYRRAYTNGAAVPATGLVFTEWQELSGDPSDSPLRRLDFLAAQTGTYTIIVEAE